MHCRLKRSKKLYFDVCPRGRLPACNQEFFRAREFSWKLDTSINISSTIYGREAPGGKFEREAPGGKVREILLLDTLKKAF